jgi:uncharacterized membrane protein YbhN (UPF0104 family)
LIREDLAPTNDGAKEDSSSSESDARAAMIGWSVASILRRTLPWVVAAVVLAYLFRRVSFGESLAAARRADLLSFGAAALLGVVTWFLLESTAFSYLFSRFNAPLTRGEARSLRALTYLLTPINWNLGTAAIVLHLRRSKGIAALSATSSILFYELIDGIVLSALALGGARALPASPMTATVTRAAGGLLAVEVACLAAFMLPLPPWRWVLRMRSIGVFRTHSLATWADVAVLFAIRSVYFGGFVLYFWAGTHAFSVAVPLEHLAAVVPAILLVGSLPITPAGLGTQQAAMLYFFSPFGSEAQILAYGLVYPVALIVARVPLGLLYARDLALLRER